MVCLEYFHYNFWRQNSNIWIFRAKTIQTFQILEILLRFFALKKWDFLVDFQRLWWCNNHFEFCEESFCFSFFVFFFVRTIHHVIVDTKPHRLGKNMQCYRPIMPLLFLNGCQENRRKRRSLFIATSPARLARLGKFFIGVIKIDYLKPIHYPELQNFDQPYLANIWESTMNLLRPI